MRPIAAISTPMTGGGIAVVRVSGDGALDIAMKVLKIKTETPEPRRFYYGIADTGRFKDEVMAVYFSAPKSYTREDVVEIHCHGSTAVAEGILRALIEHGAAAAEAGEFTKRAFLNHRIDLTQAEAVIDIINAQSTAQINAAYGALKGGLFRRIERVQKLITEMTAAAGAAVDYPEEGIEAEEKTVVRSKLTAVIKELKALINEYNGAVLVKEGVKVAIAGEPNVGKSMLLNALTNKERAIVTDVPGTTRDTLDEQYAYKGLKFVLTDTAGIRETTDKIERLGIERTFDALHKADVILAVSEDGRAFNGRLDYGKPVIKVKNKSDLVDGAAVNAVNYECDTSEIRVSALLGTNIDALKELIFRAVNGSGLGSGGESLNNARHFNAAVDALERLENALERLDEATLDCTISDLNHAFRALGRITGATSSEETVNEIFSRFCVGK